MSYGVTAEGFNRKTLENIVAELEALYRANLGAGVNLQPESPYAQILGVHAGREDELWQLAEACYQARRADMAGGVAQDTLYALSGARRLPATRSSVVLTCGGQPGTPLSAGRQVSIDGRYPFVTLADAVIGAGGTVDVAAAATEYGPIIAVAGSLTTIDTAVGGWDSVTNAEDAVLGRNRELDAAFRLRREQLLHGTGNAACDALRAAVLAVDGVTACTIFENTSSAEDAEGRPPHSVEAVVQGGADEDVGAAVWKKAAGIRTFGDTEVQVLDSRGDARTVFFSRTEELEIYVDISADWAVPGDPEYVDGVTLSWEDAEDALIEAVLAYAASKYSGGVSVYASMLAAAAAQVPGAKNIVVTVGTSSPPAASSVAVNSRQVAGFASARIRVLEL